MKKERYATGLIVILASLILLSPAQASLNTDTITIKVYGTPINLTPALNIKLSFSNPNVAKLAPTSPIFQASGANQLLSEANPNSGVVSVVWDEIIPNHEANITVMLLPGNLMGSTNISVDSVEIAGGIDITDSIVALVDPPSVSNSVGKIITPFGDFTLVDSGRLVAPGTAAIAFKIENKPSILSDTLSATLNGNEVDFSSDRFGISVIDLPQNGGKQVLSLTVSNKNQTQTIHLGDVEVEKGINFGLPPRINRALAINTPGDTKLKISGRKFGVRRFGREKVRVEIVPLDIATTNNNLRRRATKERLSDQSCVPLGSYVNISHPAGTSAKKIIVDGGC